MGTHTHTHSHTLTHTHTLTHSQTHTLTHSHTHTHTHNLNHVSNRIDTQQLTVHFLLMLTSKCWPWYSSRRIPSFPNQQTISGHCFSSESTSKLITPKCTCRDGKQTRFI